MKRKAERLQEQRTARQEEADRISAFMFELHGNDAPLAEFNNKLWLAVVNNREQILAAANYLANSWKKG